MPHNDVAQCILMEVFYFGLNKGTQQTIDVVFVGGMLKSSYKQIKTTLDSIKNQMMMTLTLVEEEEKRMKKDWIITHWWHYKVK